MSRLWALLVLFAASIITGCSEPKPTETTKVTLQLKWFINAGFVGDLVAKEKGFWKEEGLDVTVNPGGVGIAPIKMVTTGAAEFGVATGDQLLLGVVEGNPIVAIALAYQQNPLAWIVRTDSNIKSAADFKGKRIGLTYIDDEPLFNAMMKKVNLDPKEGPVLVPVKFDTSPFFRREIDAFPIFRNTQGIEIGEALRPEGIETLMVGPADHGIVSYSNLYFTTKDYLTKHPDVVKAFVVGVIRGWDYAQRYPDEASEIVAKYDKETKPSVLKQSVKATNLLVKPSAEQKIGEMTREGWESTQDILLQANQLKKVLELGEAYDNKFVDEFYAHK